jgi:enoyl-CoA hydratase/carnithine racemase
MRYRTFRYETINHVGMLNLVGPLKGQAEISSLSDELNDLCAEINSNGELRIMVLSDGGEGDLSVILEDLEPGSDRPSIAEPIAKLDLPVIAAIHRDAIGQGLELALACDIRVSAESSCFGFPHIQRGFIPCDGGTQRLSRLVGRAKALEMIFTGERIEAQEALRIGLVNRVESSGDLMPAVLKMAKEMSSKAPLALKYAKETIYKGMDLTLEQGLHLESDLYLLLHTTRDRVEGISAFREKRTPRFEGK